jgi:hypothetical protein
MVGYSMATTATLTGMAKLPKLIVLAMGKAAGSEVNRGRRGHRRRG